MDITGDMLLEACNKARPSIRRLLGTRSYDLEDILQTACLKALQHGADFNGQSQFSTWFYTIARNEALMLFRYNNRRPALLPLAMDFKLDRPSPEDIAILRKRNQDLVDCIMLLPPKCRNEAIMWSVEDNRKPEFGTHGVRKMRRNRMRKEMRVMLEAI